MTSIRVRKLYRTQRAVHATNNKFRGTITVSFFVPPAFTSASQEEELRLSGGIPFLSNQKIKGLVFIFLTSLKLWNVMSVLVKKMPVSDDGLEQ